MNAPDLPAIPDRAKGFLFLVAVFAALAAVFYISWNLAGPVDTIIYFVLFFFSAAFLPTLIVFNLLPGFLKTAVGKLEFIMGALVFGHTWLVQVGERLALTYGAEDAFYLDGEYHEGVADAVVNHTVLGWKPFSMAYFKDEGTLREARVDPKNEVAQERAGVPVADGRGAITRGGVDARAPPGEVSGERSWLVDVKKLYTKGLAEIGDMDLVDSTEKVTMRKEAKSSSVAGWGPVIGSLLGLIIGVMVGYAFVGG